MSPIPTAQRAALITRRAAAVAAPTWHDIVNDPFTRADNATLGTAPTGQAWVNVVAGWGIASNQAQASGGVGAGSNLAVIASGVSDVRLIATIVFRVASPGFIFRQTDASNYWEFRLVGANSWRLSQTIAGVFTPVASHNGQAGAGQIVTVEALGPLVTVTVNSIVEVSFSDPFNQAATRHGLSGGNGDILDNFRIQSLS